MEHIALSHMVEKGIESADLISSLFTLRSASVLREGFRQECIAMDNTEGSRKSTDNDIFNAFCVH